MTLLLGNAFTSRSFTTRIYAVALKLPKFAQWRNKLLMKRASLSESFRPSLFFAYRDAQLGTYRQSDYLDVAEPVNGDAA
jgi:hypothetical protein